MRPRKSTFVVIYEDGAGRLSVQLDEELGHPARIGWDVQDSKLILWPARADNTWAVQVSRPANGRVRQFRARRLARAVPSGKYAVDREGNWFVAHLMEAP